MCRKKEAETYFEVRARAVGRGRLQSEAKGIVGEVDRGRKGGVPFGVKSLVGEMGKPSLSCADILGDFDRLSDGEVGGVGFFAESVNDQDGNVADLISDRGWDCGAIG